MTEVQLKKLLRQLYAVQIQDSLLEECSKTPESNPETLPYSGNIQLRIVGEALDILGQNERFIIETHLVYHHARTEAMTLFSEENRPGCRRSERTLKRIRSRASKKMVNFIDHSQLREYFHRTQSLHIGTVRQ